MRYRNSDTAWLKRRTPKKAKEVLDELKLIPAIYYIETDEYNIDTVIKTVPEAGTKLKPYERVELHMAD